MSVTREQLISDWRQELTAAEESAAASPRLAWLARMKVRLYRFLLACYGGSDWQPPAATDLAARDTASSEVVFDSQQAAELGGKPAKSEVQIRSVLTAVAKAQDDLHAPGPLTGGLDHDSWVVVAAASSKLKLGQSVRLLQSAGLHPRACYRGDDRMIEVPACERHEAFEVIEQNRHHVKLPPETPRTQPVPLLMQLGAAAVVSAWISIMLAWMLVVSIYAYAGPLPGNRSLAAYLFSPEILALWAGLFLIVLQLAVLFLVRRPHTVKSATGSDRAKRRANV